MDPRIAFVSGVVALVMGLLAANRVAVDVAMVGGLTLLLLGDSLWGGILSLPQALSGFANPALLLIAALFVVAAGLERTGGIEKLARLVLGRPRSQSAALLRLMVPVALMSGLMNNTPIVAMYLGIVRDWSRRLQISASVLYIPLSFAAILGGKLTLFGTASNVVLLGLYRDHIQQVPPSKLGPYELSQLEEFWGIAWLGIPTTIVGLAVIVAAVTWWLPHRKPVEGVGDTARRFHVEMRIAEGSAISGKTVQDAGLRHLPGLFLASIERQGETTVAGRGQKLLAGDHLAFVGALDSVLDLRKIAGLLPVETNQQGLPEAVGHDTLLLEAVVSNSSPLVGRSVRESNFRATYNAAIWAVHRNGEQLQGQIGQITLRPGDTLLIEARPGHAAALRHNPAFYLTSPVLQSDAIRHDRANVALAILAAMVTLITATSLPASVAALTGGALMILTRCLRSSEAQSAINWQVITVIGAALGIGQAMHTTGAAPLLASQLLLVFGQLSPAALLFFLFLITALVAQLITNNGAAVMMFPIFMSVAEQGKLSPHALLFTLMVAAGSTFLSPISYQTNLMVYGPGGYRFLDFGRVGAPLTVALALCCAVLAPLVY